MPLVNEIKLGHEIEKKPPLQRFIYAACDKCDKLRWVVYLVKEDCPRCSVCASCGKGKQKGYGRGYYDKDGYVFIFLPWEHPFISMANGRGYTYEHRLVMAEHLGRILEKEELVHHLNGIKKDNQIENLTLITRGAHAHLEVPYKKRIQELELRIEELESFTIAPQADCYSEVCGGLALC